jgi:GNAT superfamily N-acetyltransferase
MISIERIAPDARTPRFWSLLGPLALSTAVKGEMPYLCDHAGRTWYLAFDGGRLVGFGGLDPKPRTKTFAAHHYLNSLYVVPDARGHGIGRLLVSARLADCALGSDVRTMCIQTLQPLYESLGFVVKFSRGGYRHMKRGGTGEK